MQVWAVYYRPPLFTDTASLFLLTYTLFSYIKQLYQFALSLLDQESQIRIKRFYRRDDSCSTFQSKSTNGKTQDSLKGHSLVVCS